MALIQTLNINRGLARVAVEAAIAESLSLGRLCCIAVVDAAGNLVSFDRMDRAPLQSVGLSQDKAHSVAANGLANDEFWELIKDDPCLVSGAQQIKGLIWLGGGLPFHVHGDLIGAIGVSGDGGMADDKAIAAAGVAAVQRLLSASSTELASPPVPEPSA